MKFLLDHRTQLYKVVHNVSVFRSSSILKVENMKRLQIKSINGSIVKEGGDGDPTEEYISSQKLCCPPFFFRVEFLLQY